MKGIIFVHPLDWKATKQPRWKSTIGIDDQQRVYVAGALTGYSELTIQAVAAFDGARRVSDRGHVYFDSKWLASNYPLIAEVCAAAERMAARHIASDEFKAWAASP